MDNPTLTKQAKDALSLWLALLPWDYFFTVTHKKECRDTIYHTEKVGQFLSNLPGVARCFLATEQGNLTPLSIHHHGLVFSNSNVPVLNCGELWAKCFNRFGRSRFQEIEKIGGVSSYCANYITRKTSEYGFYTNSICALEISNRVEEDGCERWRYAPGRVWMPSLL